MFKHITFAITLALMPISTDPAGSTDPTTTVWVTAPTLACPDLDEFDASKARTWKTEEELLEHLRSIGCRMVAPSSGKFTRTNSTRLHGYCRIIREDTDLWLKCDALHGGRAYREWNARNRATDERVKKKMEQMLQ
jgi:hypothetical protein